MSIVRYLLLILVVVVSCNNPYPGFTKTEEGIYFRLLKVGENDRCCQFGDFVTANLSYSTLSDSVFFREIRTFRVSEPNFPGSINRCLTMMCRLDSAQFIISAIDFYEKTLGREVPDFLRANGKIKISVKLIDTQSPREYEAFLTWVEGLSEYERLLLRNFTENIEVQPTEDGIYLIEQAPGEGPLISAGDTITIHFEGFFLNGRFFDSTRRRNEPMHFVFGQQWQVIPALEKAIARMRNGGKSLVITPSELAFGSEGSVLGIVPPYTSVIFELEIVNVKR